MAYTYNHDRSHDERNNRCDELERKSCLRADARFVVIRGWGAYDGVGAINDHFTDHQTFFSDLRTARAYAHHASDMYDAQYGIYRYEFIQGVDVR
tara:strand:- start:695 stop:979 length:285 start_codon:yes stop_codon:yes gene_type:complete